MLLVTLYLIKPSYCTTFLGMPYHINTSE